jgi:nitrile hydratase
MSESAGTRYSALRARALESLLLERNVLSNGAVETLVRTYRDEIGPGRGARIVARAWTDEAFRERLLRDGSAAASDLGIGGFTGETVVAVENTPTVHNVVTNTLQCCYPWALLGLAPSWYTSAEYRARVVRDPRGVLAEFGVELAADVEIRVWDSTTEVRYLVIPMRPAGTESLSEDELAKLVSRDAMVGTALTTCAPVQHRNCRVRKPDSKSMTLR